MKFYDVDGKEINKDNFIKLYSSAYYLPEENTKDNKIKEIIPDESKQKEIIKANSINKFNLNKEKLLEKIIRFRIVQSYPYNIRI